MNMEDDIRYLVVVNDEEQHSIWLADRPLPPGWSVTGFTGSREECLANIGEVWTDITPRSVRERIAAQRMATQSGTA